MTPDLSRLEKVAELVIRRVLSEPWTEGDIREKLERAYPFHDLPFGRLIWEDAVERHLDNLRVSPERERS